MKDTKIAYNSINPIKKPVIINRNIILEIKILENCYFKKYNPKEVKSFFWNWR